MHLCALQSLFGGTFLKSDLQFAFFGHKHIVL